MLLRTRSIVCEGAVPPPLEEGPSEANRGDRQWKRCNWGRRPLVGDPMKRHPRTQPSVPWTCRGDCIHVSFQFSHSILEILLGVDRGDCPVIRSADGGGERGCVAAWGQTRWSGDWADCFKLSVFARETAPTLMAQAGDLACAPNCAPRIDRRHGAPAWRPLTVSVQASLPWRLRATPLFLRLLAEETARREMVL